ncbi:hypothetical protein I79_017237 [Cricetulus griseus]|uniref:Uncharacterized protein n=1 Tax=Cricetulus griseus TaxID=10029 RepID=G3I1I0_CRIGR|nr:hypothetical protein I79_017237 [Cricetulus griseus]
MMHSGSAVRSGPNSAALPHVPGLLEFGLPLHRSSVCLFLRKLGFQSTVEH